MAAPDQLIDRHVLVVGAGTRRSSDPDAPMGNGRAIAVEAARAGAIVACADVDPQAAADTVAMIEAIRPDLADSTAVGFGVTDGLAERAAGLSG